MAIAPDIQARLLEHLARFEIEAFERARAIAGWRSPDAAALDLAREEALQSTLRQALYLGDRDVARKPLRHVAAHLGITLDENDNDWTALAYEATKVLLDVSQERARRQQGIYDQPTVFFQRAVAASGSNVARPDAGSGGTTVAPAAFACASLEPRAALPASFATSEPRASAMQIETVMPDNSDKPMTCEDAAPSTPASAAMHNSTSLTPIIAPAGLKKPEGYDEDSWQKARIAARAPRIHVDRKLLSEESLAALEKERGITLPEAVNLYVELRSPDGLPKGWERKPLAEHVRTTRGLSYKGKHLCGSGDGVPLHNLNSIFEGGGYKDDGAKYYDGDFKPRHEIHPGDLIVANTEQSFGLELIGHAALVPSWLGPSGIFSQHLYKVEIRPGSPLSKEWIYLGLSIAPLGVEIRGFSNGTTVNMLPADAFEIPETAIPPAEIVEKMNEIVRPAFAQQERLREESRTLAALRDALLPRLMSGELRIREAEKQIQEVV